MLAIRIIENIPVEVAEMLKPARVVPELASPSPESHMLFDLEALL